MASSRGHPLLGRPQEQEPASGSCSVYARNTRIPTELTVKFPNLTVIGHGIPRAITAGRADTVSRSSSN